MGDDTTILEGAVKYRDGRKWKERWCVVRRLSPVADSVELSLYACCPTAAAAAAGSRGSVKAALSLSRWLGSVSGFTLDAQSHTLLLVCADVQPLLALTSRELMLQWRARLDRLLTAPRRYDVVLLSGSGREQGALLLQGGRMALVTGQPVPALKGVWEIQHLRRFGVVEGRFLWEGGALSGASAGAYCVAATAGDVSRLQRDVASAAKGLLTSTTQRTNTEPPSPSRSHTSSLSRRAALSRSVSPCSVSMPRCVSCAAALSSAPFSASWSLGPPPTRTRPRPRPAHLSLSCGLHHHHRDELCSAPASSYDNYDVPRVPSIDGEGEYYDTPRRLRAAIGGRMSRSVTAGALSGAHAPRCCGRPSRHAPTALYATVDRSRKRRRPPEAHYENSVFARSLQLYENVRELAARGEAEAGELQRSASAEYLPMRPLPPWPPRPTPAYALMAPSSSKRALSDPLLLSCDDVTRWPPPCNRHSSSSADSGVVCADPPPRPRSLSPPRRAPRARAPNAPSSAEAAVPLHPRAHTDTRSTSSGTSDLSDCFETMSLSSHSSLEASRGWCRPHACVAPPLSQRPRSGREYARPSTAICRPPLYSTFTQ